VPGSKFACSSRVGEDACEGVNNHLVIKFPSFLVCVRLLLRIAPLHVGSQNAVYDCRVPQFFRERGTILDVEKTCRENLSEFADCIHASAKKLGNRTHKL